MSKKNNIDKGKKVENSNNNRSIVAVTIAVVVVVLGLLVAFNIKSDNDVITRVMKVSNDGFDSVRCINTECNAVIAKTRKNKTYENRIYNSYGKLISKYSEKEANAKIPYDFSNDYVLAQKKSTDDVVMYYLINSKGKELYKTKGRLIKINEEYILEERKGKVDYVYSILNKKGKAIYKNITEYSMHDDNKYIYVKKEDKSFILDSKLKTVANEYRVKEEVKDEDDKVLYLVVTNTKNDLDYYFSTEKGRVINEGFNNYTVKSDKSLEVERKENDKKVIYNINKKGREKKIEVKSFVSQYIKNFRKKIDSNKYYLYTISLKDEKQKYVFVDNKEDKSFGVYNVDKNSYDKLFSYSGDNIYSAITTLESKDDKVYYQISCNKPSCDETKMYVYNFTDKKEVFNLSGNSKIAINYTQYKNDYKVVKFSYKSENTDYKGKYVLFNKDNEELLVSGSQIVVTDSNEVIEGETTNDKIIMFSSKSNKVVNDDNSLATKLDIKNLNYYKYSNKEKTVIVDDRGKTVYSVKNGDLIEYNNDNIFAISSDDIKIYDLMSKKTESYKFKKNESINDLANTKMTPYGSVAFVNNEEDNYAKIINAKGKELIKIKDSKIYKVSINKTHKKAFVITLSKNKKKDTKYYIYLAK